MTISIEDRFYFDITVYDFNLEILREIMNYLENGR